VRDKKTALFLAKAQLEGGVPWGEVIIGTSHLFICQMCGTESRVSEGLDPCAFCNSCKDEVLDILAKAVLAGASRAQRRARA